MMAKKTRERTVSKDKKHPPEKSESVPSPPDPNKERLTHFERWQVGTTVFQTLLLCFTLLAAIYIGLEQNKISKKLYDLSFTLSLEIAYDVENNRLNIFNKGKENIWLWSSKLYNFPPTLRGEGRLITPGGYYYLLAEKLRNVAIKKVGENGDLRLPWKIFFEGGDGKKYIVSVLLFIQMKKGQMSVHTQTLSIIQSDWSN